MCFGSKPKSSTPKVVPPTPTPQPADPVRVAPDGANAAIAAAQEAEEKRKKAAAAGTEERLGDLTSRAIMTG